LTNATPLSQKRRGLSSIVGALLFVVLMVATFAVLGVALDSQTDIVETSRQVTDAGLKKQQERFVINSIVQLPGDSLQVNVTNTGQNPSEIFTLVLTNSSDVTNGYPTQTIEIPSDTSFLPPNSNTPVDIVGTLDFKMKDSPSIELYQFKIISSLGNIEKLFVVCQNGACGQGGGGGSSGLFAQFLMDGPNGINTKNSTAVMFVTNTGEVPLDDVAPNFACSKGAMFSISPDVEDDDDFKSCELVPDSIDTLSPGQTAIFKWDGEVQGEIGDVFTFCNQASGTDPDLNTVTSDFVCDELTVIDPNDCGGCGEGGETIILIDDLLIRPSIFMIIPSPFGDSPDGDDATGLWGINVANPTVKDMTVSKVTIVVYPPGGNSQDTVFQPAGGPPQYANNCSAEDISPKKGTQPQGYWNCPRDNILMWPR
jgi:archaellum component FlaF (FlaF/FlaG flagellin family)